MASASKIFTGFRALGYVSNHIPLAVRHHNKRGENYVVTSVGKAFHTYNCSRLGIVSVSNNHPGEIDCLAVDAFLVFTSCQNVVRAFDRGRQVIHTYEGHEATVHLLLPFGNHLISVDKNSCMKIWDIRSEELYLEIQFENRNFQVTALMHPNTYLNKIVLASKQGTMQLWNIKTNKLVYTFKGWNEAILVLEQAPAVDVAGIGMADGQIYLHNLRFDETVMSFRQEWGPVTAISFRTDGHPVMTTGSSVGHIALWDLEERKLKSQIRRAHDSAVSGMKCLPCEPLMVTSSPDNSLKVWIFDLPDEGGRLLRQRAGHSAPPSKLCYYGDKGQTILSAGQDSTLRSFSTVHEKHSKSLGRASYNKSNSKKSGLKNDRHRMPSVVELAAEPCRESDWDNIVCVHRGLSMATTWSYIHSTMGKYKLRHERFETDPKLRTASATCVTISSCGNFALIGYSSGHVDMWNLQSGLYRGGYGEPTAHSTPVRGVVIDGLNQVTVSASAEGDLKFWKFKRKDLLGTLKLNTPISKINLHRESSMLAVALDDFEVHMVDLDTRQVVRVFSGHRNKITDLTFSSDARWLITSSMDSTIRVWDVPTGRLIDVFLLDSAVSSLCMSPTGDYLVTSHVDDLGVYLWANMTLFRHVPLQPLPSDFEPSILEMPSTSRQLTGEVDESSAPDEDEVYLTSGFKSPEQLSDELVTLSLLPNSRWQNLLHLDVIKMRNKPKEPPRVPKSAPFFLPTIPGLEPQFAPMEAEDTSEKGKSRVVTGHLQPLTVIGQELLQASSTEDFRSILKKFKELGPSAIDLEIRSLSSDNGGSTELMGQFLRFIQHILATKKDFELAHAYLGLFLKLHGEQMTSEPHLIMAAKELANQQEASWQHLQRTFNQTLCLVNYLRSATL
ncbi:WD repeat-containing protein 36-like [Liolophura sinensis]|uniref:WD repeat-containing protein 36-like n=1 Tax=Liolophura sinensis TaxID=3198878 RepID=UPI003158AA1D